MKKSQEFLSQRLKCKKGASAPFLLFYFKKNARIPVMNKITPELEKLVLEAAEYPEKRTKIFYDIGQQFLKPLHDRELQEEVYSIFQYMYEHADKWKSNLMLPEYYRRDKEKPVFGDIWFTVRDYFAWCVLYPDEAEQYFTMDETGQVQVLANPKIRILDKDNKKDVYKSELGKQILTQVKKDRITLIKSGFNLGQKDEILTVCLVGLMALPPGYKKAPPPVKKVTAKQKGESKVLIKEAVAKQKVKITLKETNDLSLALIEADDLTQAGAEKLLKQYIKDKNA